MKACVRRWVCESEAGLHAALAQEAQESAERGDQKAPSRIV